MALKIVNNRIFTKKNIHESEKSYIAKKGSIIKKNIQDFF